MIHEPDSVHAKTNGEAAGCPFHAAQAVHPTQKTANPTALRSDSRVTQDANGVWQIHGFAESRAVLRHEHTVQAGFGAERISMMPDTMKTPVLYQEGEAHRDQRTKTARFFTPVTTDKKYRGFMQNYAKNLVAKLEQQGRADLNELSMKLAVQVAAQVIGLTDSRVRGMDARINAFFEPFSTATGLRKLLNELQDQFTLAKFFFLDVQPAIRRRKRDPQEDLISHLIAEDYGPIEILTECVTYGAAGMVTTREFICVAAWHFLESPALKETYLNAEEKERYQILHELLRLEPVVGTLMRRATKDITLETEGESVTIPAGELIHLSVYSANEDEQAVGDTPLNVCPMRETAPKVQSYVMSFGDGNHRCPGAYVAIQETDIFLQELLKLDLTLESGPALDWDELTTGYELRKMVVTVQ